MCPEGQAITPAINREELDKKDPEIRTLCGGKGDFNAFITGFFTHAEKINEISQI